MQGQVVPDICLWFIARSQEVHFVFIFTHVVQEYKQVLQIELGLTS